MLLRLSPADPAPEDLHPKPGFHPAPAALMRIAQTPRAIFNGDLRAWCQTKYAIYFSSLILHYGLKQKVNSSKSSADKRSRTISTAAGLGAAGLHSLTTPTQYESSHTSSSSRGRESPARALHLCLLDLESKAPGVSGAPRGGGCSAGPPASGGCSCRSTGTQGPALPSWLPM